MVWEQDDYQENLNLLQGAANELLGHMKGHDYSFRREITDAKGEFSQEKLQGLVEEMLSLWEAYHQVNLLPAYTDAGLRERRELYGLYLYLVMRCSLEKGAYSDIRSGTNLKERTDFAFLLKQAKSFILDWYAEPKPDGSFRNEVYGGYDAHFGFHIYYALNDPDVLKGSVNPGNDFSLTPDWKITKVLNKALEHRLTQPQSEKAEKSEERMPLDDDGFDPLDNDSYDPLADDSLEDDNWGFLDTESYYNHLLWLGEEDERTQRVSMMAMHLAMHFKCPEEYRTACKRFVELFTEAPPELPRDFYDDLEKIVDLYLIKRGIPPLLDKDRTLDVYNHLCDGALRQAARYGRGIQWKVM